MGAKRFLVAVRILALSALGFGSARADFQITDLGTLSTIQSQGNGVNGGGSAAGTFTTPEGHTHAFQASSSGAATDLGTLGGPNSVGFAISGGGLVTGSSDVIVPGGGVQTHAFRSAASGALVDLGTLGGAFSEGLGIDGGGRVVGDSTLANGQTHAFVTGGSGALLDLGTLPGYVNSLASGINDAGQVVGTATSSFNTSHAFLLTLGGGPIIDLGSLPGGVNSHATGINNPGVVVGYADDADGTSHAVRTNMGVFQNLGGLPGGTSSFAFGINDSGQIVGQSLAGPSGFRATLWDPTLGIVDLNTMIAPGSGWTLTAAFGVSNPGYITGVGTFQGTPHAYLLTPVGVPAPPALALLAIGGAGMMARMRSGGARACEAQDPGRETTG
jgi:probable HAF family extracellular repeat protein